MKDQKEVVASSDTPEQQAIVSASETEPHWIANFAKRRRGAPKPPKGTPQRAEYDRLANERSRGRKKAQEAKDAAKVDCQTEIDEDRAREILTTERNLRHPQV